MESTQNKIYEIEDAAQFEEGAIKLDEKNDENGKDLDMYNYGDQFDENPV